MPQEKCVYIVSGYMRSGTSMMMKCLDCGGIPAVYSKKKDRYLNEKYARGTYQPNPEGFYELTPKDFNSPKFPEAYADSLIKVLHWRLENLPVFNYRLIFMERDPVEIEVSYLKMFQRRPPFILYRYSELLEKIYAALDHRSDVHYLPVTHRELIRSPRETLKKIQGNGWPIKNIEKAAQAVNPALYRSKAEDLKTVQEAIPGLRTDLPDQLETARKK